MPHNVSRRDGPDNYNPHETINNLFLRGERDIKSDVGLEFEIEGTNLPFDITKFWNTERDGSIRNGYEYVLARPIKREQVESALQVLKDAFKRHSSQIIPSNRCSTHVHLNMTNTPFKDMCSLLALYFIVEEALTDWIGEDRPGNLFAIRAVDGEGVVRIIRDMIEQGQFGPHNLNGDNIKYAALNLSSLRTFGSVEFRAFRGIEVDPFEVMPWLQAIFELKDATQRFNDPEEVILEFSARGPEAFVRQYLPHIWTLISDQEDVERKLGDGMVYGQDIAYAIRWEDNGKTGKKQRQTSPATEEIRPMRFEMRR